MIVFKAFKECLIDTASIWAILIMIPVFIVLNWANGYDMTLSRFLIFSGFVVLIPTIIILTVFIGKYRIYVMLAESRPMLEEMKKAVSDALDEMFKKEELK